MRRAVAITLAGLALSCETGLTVEPEGYLCDPGDLCPDGYRCLEGVCRVDRCQGVVCGSPPGPQCSGGTTLRTFQASGACDPSTGTCAYPAQESSCPNGCLDGACVGTCGTCQSPPAPACLDASTLRTFSSPGSCQGGACSYPASERACANGCEAGRCKDEDLCANVRCESPPPATCVGGSVRAYASPGACDASTGGCTYGFVDTPCAGVCANGACAPAGLSFAQIGPALRHQVNAVDQAPGSSGNHVLAVGPGGAVSKWDGARWSSLPSGTTADLHAVWLSSQSSGWIAGSDKTLLRYDGATLTPVSLPAGSATAKLVGVHGRSGNVLVASEEGEYWRLSGGLWTRGALTTRGPYRMSAVYVSSDGRERIVGSCGSPSRGCVAVASGPSGGFFTDEDTTTGSSEAFRSVGPSIDASYLGTALLGRASSPVLRRHRNASPYIDATGLPTSLVGGSVEGITAATTATGQAVYLLTGWGSSGARLYRYSSATGLDAPLLQLYLGGANGGGQALSRNESGGVVVADSGPQSATLYRRGAITNEVLALGEHWREARFAPSGGLVAMTFDGDLAIRSSLGTAFRVSPSWDMHALAVASTYALVGGAKGELYRHTFGSSAPFQQVATGVTSTLRAACRASDTEVYVVGDDGFIARYDGLSATRLGAPSKAHLRAVHCPAPGMVVACGEGGVVLTLSGGSWSALAAPPTGATALTSCRMLGGALWVAGDGAFARFENDAWTSLSALPGLSSLQVRSADEIYAIAGGAEVVRFDGAGWRKLLTTSAPLWGGDSTTGRVVFVGSHGAVAEGT